MSTEFESVLIFGFPGVGKSYAKEHEEEYGLSLQDSDSSHFHWLYRDNEFKDPVLDEDGKKVIHPEWPANYVRYIELTGREQSIKPDFIFVSTHEEVMKALLPLRFMSYTLVPTIDQKERYLKLYKERGSSDEFIELMDKNWEKFIKGTEERATNHEYPDNMLINIWPTGKIQSVADLITLDTVRAMDFEKEE